MIFKVNNLSVAIGRILFIQQPVQGYNTRIQPLKAFQHKKKLLSVFLEDGSSLLNFQEMSQSRYTSEDTMMEPTILRCFRDILAVMYKIGSIKTVIVYQIYEEEYGEEDQMTFEQRNFVPESETPEREGRRKKRFKLRQLLEVDSGVLADSTLHDMFFLEKDILCLMVDSDMVVCKILGVDGDSLSTKRPKTEYFKVRIKGNDDMKLKVRKFELDRMNECLYYMHGKTITKFEKLMVRCADKMMVAGRIDLRRLKEKLRNLGSGGRLTDEEHNSSIELQDSILDDQPSFPLLHSPTNSNDE